MAVNTNQVVLVGNLTKDVEEVKVNDKNMVFKSTIAVNDFNDDVIYMPIEVWNKQGRNFSNYCGKGDKIVVTGRLKQDRFENKEGQDVTVVKVNASLIEFINTKSEEKSSNNQGEDNKDLPF